MRVLFSFPPFIGHLSSALPVAKSLRDAGHDVHFLSSEIVRDKIEAVGATFHSAAAHQPEFYEGRAAEGPLGPLEDLFEQYGLNKASFLPQLQTLNMVLEMQLPGTLRIMRALTPDVVVYDSLVRGRDAQMAARLLGIPAVAMFSLAGAGAWTNHSPATLLPLTLAEAGNLVAEFVPNVLATARLNLMYKLDLPVGLPLPVGKLDTFGSNLVIVNTSEDLQDPLDPELAKSYAQDGAAFNFVGPLLETSVEVDVCIGADPVLDRVRAARAVDRPVILVSMGTLLVSTHGLNGWHGRSGGQRSLSGRELCQAAWTGAFDAFGAVSADEGPLVVVSLGPQPDALEGIMVPPNALCVPNLAQMAILREGVDVFLTHGGQNSFTEAMSCGTPVVVCPGFGDQVVNSHKAVALGVGLRVGRPHAAVGEEELVSARYRSEVCSVLLEVSAVPAFRAAAVCCAERLTATGGVSRAVELILNAAVSGCASPKCASSESPNARCASPRSAVAQLCN